ncbi:MAG: hypothetical protein WDN26_12230 [Chitinophagaceae bacterium]
MTTYYYENGSTSQTEQFAYSTCEPISGGGGGEKVMEMTLEMNLKKKHIGYAQFTLNVLDIENIDGGGICEISDRVYAKFHKIHWERDKFRNCYFIKSDVKNNTQGGTSSISVHSVTGLGTDVLTLAVTGAVNFPDMSYIPFTKTRSYQLGEFGWAY